jgi:hypothetical protein
MAMVQFKNVREGDASYTSLAGASEEDATWITAGSLASGPAWGCRTVVGEWAATAPGMGFENAKLRLECSEELGRRVMDDR